MNVVFEKSKNTTIEWLTPPELVKSLGDFDLDPCTPVNPPFVHAKENFNINDDGLTKEWFGRVYMNPPYGKGMERWILPELKLSAFLIISGAMQMQCCSFEEE